MKKTQNKIETKIEKCSEDCPIHGNLKIRGRKFQGYVTKKFEKRIVVEFDRVIYIQKYERYMKKKTKLHARLPQCQDVNVGDYVEIGECRPLSKIIHFTFIRKIRGEEK